MDSIKIFDTAEETADKLANYIKEQLDNCSNKFYLAISGGSTPKMLFQALVKIKDKVDWKKLLLYWVDERCVAPDQEESNYKMTLDSLISKVDIPEENIFRMKGELAPDQGLADYNKFLEVLPQKNKLPVFDLVILGMGDDGHTASIFPPQLNLLTLQQPLAIGTNPYSQQKRITLTGPTIKNAEQIIFHVTGKAKSQILNIILSKQENYQAYPAAEFAFGKTTCWYVDKQAIGKL